ncbi:hypothetical protein FA95DRAFT_106867 [Auriscalpium vulgare]|uniref:Uncharacterized protein n=1 Tax=Auriscalpium vulgare TaxID=40419 RepID=A0ACB8RNS4_9AGAM|nr:hypothetical protein FA95DRAFT_106867 [Auriscalpium vulgare]
MTKAEPQNELTILDGRSLPSQNSRRSGNSLVYLLLWIRPQTKLIARHNSHTLAVRCAKHRGAEVGQQDRETLLTSPATSMSMRRYQESNRPMWGSVVDMRTRARQAKGQIVRDRLAATGDGEQMKRFRIKLERYKVKSERDSNGLVAVQGGAPPQPVGRQCTWERKGARGAPPPTRPRVGTTFSSNTSFATVRTNDTGAQLYINSDDERFLS